MRLNKKICFILPQFKTGGGNRVFIELANELVKNKEVEIIYPNNSLETNTFFLDNKIKCLIIGKYKNSKLHKILNLFLLIKWLKINRKEEIIIITDPIMSLLSCFFSKKNLYRFIQADDYKIFDLNREIIKTKLLLLFYKKLTKLSYRYKNIKVLFNSEFVYEEYKKNSKLNKKKNIIHPGVNLEIFKCLKSLDQKDKISICLVARKHPLKGLNKFLEFWEKLDYKYKNKIKKVNIIYFEEIKELKKYKNQFTLINPSSDLEIRDILNESTIFISTSLWEGFGLPALEAMACGCVVLSSNNGGCNEYIINRKNGLLYDINDIEDLEKNFIFLLNNFNIRRKMALEAIKTAKKFSWKKSTEQFLNILTEDIEC